MPRAHAGRWLKNQSEGREICQGLASAWLGLGAGSAQAGNATCLGWNLVQQFGAELGLGTPAGTLLEAGRALDLHCALVGLTTQRAVLWQQFRALVHGSELGLG